jgi:hypothetical protein
MRDKHSAVRSGEGEHGPIIESSKSSFMSCREVNGWLAAFQASDDRNVKIRVGLETNSQERASCISSSLR